MPTLQSYRIFLASPGGLSKERQAFRDVIERFNQSEAIPEGFHFQAIGWEETLGGTGRPQGLINEELRTCDFFILMLSDRWGSAPDGPTSPYTSGTEEEYHVAMECLAAGTMRQALILFKSVSVKQLSDPGKELSKVLDFKKKLEEGREHLYKSFDSINRFKELLRDHLVAWLRQAKRGDAQPSTPTTSTPKTVGATNPIGQETENTTRDPRIVDAWRFADEGKLTEAEMAFARAIISTQRPYALIEYGHFLERMGLFDRATGMFEDALTMAAEQQDEVAQAVSYNALGNVFRTRGDLDKAEATYRQAMAINERIGRLEGLAACYSYLVVEKH